MRARVSEAIDWLEDLWLCITGDSEATFILYLTACGVLSNLAVLGIAVWKIIEWASSHVRIV
jgi:hypothetical protein